MLTKDVDLGGVWRTCSYAGDRTVHERNRLTKLVSCILRRWWLKFLCSVARYRRRSRTYPVISLKSNTVLFRPWMAAKCLLLVMLCRRQSKRLTGLGAFVEVFARYHCLVWWTATCSHLAQADFAQTCSADPKDVLSVVAVTLLRQFGSKRWGIQARNVPYIRQYSVVVHLAVVKVKNVQLTPFRENNETIPQSMARPVRSSHGRRQFVSGKRYGSGNENVTVVLYELPETQFRLWIL